MAYHVLVPLNGKPFAELALPYAEELVRKSGGSLQLVRASLVRHALSVEHYEAQLVADERAYLAGVVRRLAEHGVKAVATVQHADPPEAIVGQAQQWGADLIVMATRERGALGQFVFGSVATGVVGQTPTPLLLVAERENVTPAAPFGAVPKLLVSLDGSTFAEAALPVATQLARVLGASLVLLTVLPDRGPLAGLFPTAADETGAERQVADYLVDQAERLRQTGLSVEGLVRSGNPAAVIRDVVEEAGATLVVMATHGRTGVQRLVLGSVADAVLRAVEVPIALVRPVQQDA